MLYETQDRGTAAVGGGGGAVGLIYFGGLFRSGGRATALTYGSDLAVFLLAELAAVRIFLPAITLRLRDRWRSRLRGQFCDFASALTNALAGGMNISQALQSAQSDLSAQYAPDAYISLELQEILDGVNNNIPVETMLEDFGARSGIADIASFATVFSTCYRTGGNIRAVVRRATEIISEKMMISSEIETALTSNKVQMYAMNLLPVGLILLMRVMSSQFAQSFSTLIGVVGLSISGALTVAASADVDLHGTAVLDADRSRSIWRYGCGALGH